LKIVQHWQQTGDEISLLSLRSLVGCSVQTLAGFVSLALKLLPQLLKTRLHFLSLLLSGPRAHLELLHVTGLEVRSLNDRITISILIVIQLNATPIGYANFRIVISSALLISAEEVSSHAIPAFENLLIS
jgi:hypothetical protein